MHPQAIVGYARLGVAPHRHDTLGRPAHLRIDTSRHSQLGELSAGAGREGFADARSAIVGGFE
jgi:hypothetical protein